MTELKIGVVEVFVLRKADSALQVLVLRRARGTRCTGAWEVVHGRVEGRETPVDTALREVREETGLTVSRLYNVTSQPFYLHRIDTVQMSVVFAGFVDPSSPVAMGVEHDVAEWLPLEAAIERLNWPRSKAALRDVAALLQYGDAGPVEDVLRVL
jgi:dihydroneopterin triphosphate diphosphatase